MRTISSDFKRKELVYQFKSKRLSILGIQDHKIIHLEEDDKMKTDVIDGCTSLAK